MSPNTPIFYRFLLVAAGINVLGLPLAVFQAEPWHAAVHAGLALATGFWALRLRHRRPDPTGALDDDDASSEEPHLDHPELGSGQQTGFDDQWLKRQSAPEEQERRE